MSNLDFSSILASSIHDMKNSLGMVLSSLDDIVDVESNSCACTPEMVAQLQYEAKRVNDNLVQLLTMYKLDNKYYSVNLSELDLADFLEESYLLNKPLLDYKNIQADIVCESDDFGYFDRDLMAGVINNLVTNAARYSKQCISLNAAFEDGYLCLSVEDDGPGFPERMLNTDFEGDDALDMVSGHTKLGLFFCTMVARLHNVGGRQGFIKLDNHSRLGGGCFTIHLPQ